MSRSGSVHYVERHDGEWTTPCGVFTSSYHPEEMPAVKDGVRRKPVRWTYAMEQITCERCISTLAERAVARA